MVSAQTSISAPEQCCASASAVISKTVPISYQCGSDPVEIAKSVSVQTLNFYSVSPSENAQAENTVLSKDPILIDATAVSVSKLPSPASLSAPVNSDTVEGSTINSVDKILPVPQPIAVDNPAWTQFVTPRFSKYAGAEKRRESATHIRKENTSRIYAKP